jgi:hypothetical protein
VGEDASILSNCRFLECKEAIHKIGGKVLLKRTEEVLPMASARGPDSRERHLRRENANHKTNIDSISKPTMKEAKATQFPVASAAGLPATTPPIPSKIPEK